MPPSDLVNWLLGAETPSIRYLTAHNLLALPESDPQVKSTRQAIMTEGIVPAIFAKQTASGQWANEQSYYTPKYVSTHWSLMLLTELCVDPTDERFQRGVEYMLTAITQSVNKHFKMEGYGFSCLWGNVLRYALYAGRANDPRTQAILEFVAKDLSDDYCHCRVNSGHSCAWGVVRSLWGLIALPEFAKNIKIVGSILDALHFLLQSYNLVTANYPVADGGKIHPMWFKLNFPLFYQADILMTLRVLAEMDMVKITGVAPALDWLEAQRLPNGRWRGSSPYRQRTWHELGDATETSRWVSLQSAMILRQAERRA
jgi:hypothetical protein